MGTIVFNFSKGTMTRYFGDAVLKQDILVGKKTLVKILKFLGNQKFEYEEKEGMCSEKSYELAYEEKKFSVTTFTSRNINYKPAVIINCYVNEDEKISFRIENGKVRVITDYSHHCLNTIRVYKEFLEMINNNLS